MKTTYKIPNIVPRLETGDMVVFYEFSNGTKWSNIIPITTPIPEIQQWGEDKCVFFDENASKIEAVVEEVRQMEIQRQVVEKEVQEAVLTRLRK